MRNLLYFSCFITFLSFGQKTVQTNEYELLEIKNAVPPQLIIHPKIIFKDNWHTLPQTIFWKQIITLSPDSCIINVACNRKVLHKVSYHEWMKKTEPQKEFFKDSLKLVHALVEAEKINVTTGKNDFYKLRS